MQKYNLLLMAYSGSWTHGERSVKDCNHEMLTYNTAQRFHFCIKVGVGRIAYRYLRSTTKHFFVPTVVARHRRNKQPLSLLDTTQLTHYSHVVFAVFQENDQRQRSLKQHQPKQH